MSLHIQPSFFITFIIVFVLFVWQTLYRRFASYENPEDFNQDVRYIFFLLYPLLIIWEENKKF